MPDSQSRCIPHCSLFLSCVHDDQRALGLQPPLMLVLKQSYNLFPHGTSATWQNIDDHWQVMLHCWNIFTVSSLSGPVQLGIIWMTIDKSCFCAISLGTAQLAKIHNLLETMFMMYFLSGAAGLSKFCKALELWDFWSFAKHWENAIECYTFQLAANFPGIVRPSTKWVYKEILLRPVQLAGLLETFHHLQALNIFHQHTDDRTIE